MVNINCKTTGTVNADGTAKMEIIQIETVVLDSVDQTFNVAADPFGYFSLSEEESGPNASFTVSISDAAGLKAALGNWLKGAALAGGQTVQQWMIEELRTEINNLVSTDGVGAALEAHVIKDLAFTTYNTDAQTGANNLVDALDLSTENKNLIGLQFPASRFGETFSPTLPALSEDTMTFQFTINSNIVVTDAVVNLVPDEANAATQATVEPTTQPSGALDVSKSRKINIVAAKP